MIRTFKYKALNIPLFSIVSIIVGKLEVERYTFGDNFGILLDISDKYNYAAIGIEGLGQVKVDRDVITGDILAYFKNENVERKLVILEDGKCGDIVKCCIDSNIIGRKIEYIEVGEMISEIKYQRVKDDSRYEFCLMDGRYLNIEQYSELYSLIGHVYDTRTEEGHFQIPNRPTKDIHWYKWIRIK